MQEYAAVLDRIAAKIACMAACGTRQSGEILEKEGMPKGNKGASHLQSNDMAMECLLPNNSAVFNCIIMICGIIKPAFGHSPPICKWVDSFFLLWYHEAD